MSFSLIRCQHASAALPSFPNLYCNLVGMSIGCSRLISSVSEHLSEPRGVCSSHPQHRHGLQTAASPHRWRAEQRLQGRGRAHRVSMEVSDIFYRGSFNAGWQTRGNGYGTPGFCGSGWSDQEAPLPSLGSCPEVGAANVATSPDTGAGLQCPRSSWDCPGLLGASHLI